MKLEHFVERMERIAPKETALSYDNPGLLISPENKNIKKVLVALDCTPATAQEAVDINADLMLVHHPLFFTAAKHILAEDPATAPAYKLIRHGIGLFAAHTNLDMALGGVNDALCERLGIVDVAPFPQDGLGRMGKLPAPMTFVEFARLVESRLCSAVRICGDGEKLVSTVALVGGAGGDYAVAAKQAGADVFLTGECKHHEAIAAMAVGLCLIDGGHYETERWVLPCLIGHLQMNCDDVEYRLSKCEISPLRRL